MASMLLHGTLDATIFEAKHFSGRVGQFIQGLVPKFDGQPTGMQQLYATVDLYKARVGRTRIVDTNPDNPKWEEEFRIYCAHYTTDIVFSVKERLPVNARLIGRAYLPVQDLLKQPKGQALDTWLPIVDEKRRPLEHGPKIHVKLRFTAVDAEPYWGTGVGGHAYAGVPKTFFKQRERCSLTLYQDAHVLDTFEPSVQLADGRPYEPHRCWEDIYDAIDGARHLVYVTGWSVDTEKTLVRDGDRRHPGGGTSIGELLKRKASEGVRVLMLVWDDPTSVLNLGIIDGKLGTKDAETFRYFRGTGVHCVPCPRNVDASENLVDYRKTLTFSHHQKCVIVDVKDAGSDRRRIVSFIGGLDLTCGRYDTQDHSLFRTLNGAHCNDFYQGNIDDVSRDKGGPREPWHDIHCKIEGPAAWDVLHNFEQRWNKQGGQDDFLHTNVLWPWKTDGDLLVDLKGMEDVILPETSPAVTDGGDQEAWNVQVFRSIDSSACAGFPKTPKEAYMSGLTSGKDHVIERSIQDAYIHAIRRAKRFIYIENQYFFGSSFAWKPDGIKPEDIEAVQLIPRELSLKIVSKIEAGEPFAVYVVIPMWPEGIPSSWNIQAMLSWQRRTMDMMYTDIAKALKARNSNASPKDYLSFFCLGNREVKLPGEYEPSGHPPHGSYEKAQKARRGMIYVHSKMMIVDDEYIIIGSANINQRSMDGARDSEIAMGAYQPAHLNTNGQFARGQIYGLRMSLWREHLGVMNAKYQDPGNPECFQMVNKKAEEFWKLYASDELEDNLHGHLLKYPIEVTSDGTVTEREGIKVFPDTDEAQVLGSIDSLFVTIGSPFTSFALTT